MGTVSRFVCSICGYEAEVSGGSDSGLLTSTVTISCSDCRELYDVMVEERATDGPPAIIAPRCPRSAAHTWKLWSSPGACPRCEGAMERGDDILFWE